MIFSFERFVRGQSHLRRFLKNNGLNSRWAHRFWYHLDGLKINRCLLAGLLITTVICCAGCISTYIAGSDTSPDAQYVIYGHIRGAGGHAYIDDTWKTVFITLETKGTQRPTIVTNYQDGVIVSEEVVAVSGKPGKLLLKKSYLVRGSDVCWNAVWGKDDSVTVSLYDYGPGVYWEDGRKKGAAKREIRTLQYVLDSKRGRFVEFSSGSP